MNACKHPDWQPNFSDSASFKKRGHLWRCFTCGRTRKTTPDSMKPKQS